MTIHLYKNKSQYISSTKAHTNIIATSQSVQIRDTICTHQQYKNKKIKDNTDIIEQTNSM